MNTPCHSPSKTSRPTSNADAISSLVKRRRLLPLGTTAVAAMGLVGCSMGGGSHGAAPTLFGPAPSPVVLSTQKQVQEFTDKIDLALDQVDRDRLRAAAERKNIPPVTSSPVVVTASAGESPHAEPRTVPAPAAPAVVVPAVPEAKIIPAEPPAPDRPASPTAAAAPLSSHASSEAIIDPIQSPQGSPPSAMGAMAAMVATTPPQEVRQHFPAANTPEAPAALDTSVDDALAVLRRRVMAHPTLNTALAMALLDAPDAKSADLSKSLSQADQKVFTDLIAALQGMNAGAASATLADRAAPLVNAAKRWQADADLSLPRLVLATRVDSFGVFTAIEPKFEGGRKHTVIIYCEVANFSSKKTDDGWYQTRLSQQETLITDDGLLIWRPNVEEVEDRSLNQRHDFYLVKKLTIPDNLAAGKYTLRMSVTDRNTNKISMVSLPIEIVGK